MNLPGWEEDDTKPKSTVVCSKSNGHLFQPFGLDPGSEDNSEESYETDQESNYDTPIFYENSTGEIKIIEDDIEEDKQDRMNSKMIEGTTIVEQQEVDEASSSELEEADQSAGGRYFGGGNGGPKCFNCGESGHISKECSKSSTLPCYLCGGSDHQRSSCPEEICYNCDNLGHVSRGCREPRKRRVFQDEYCNWCGLPGHLRKDCSLNWRRYKFSRELTRQVLNQAETLLAPLCYNCASSSHFGDECDYRRTPDYSIFHQPFFGFLQNAAYYPNNHRLKSSSGESNSHRCLNYPPRNEYSTNYYKSYGKGCDHKGGHGDYGSYGDCGGYYKSNRAPYHQEVHAAPYSGLDRQREDLNYKQRSSSSSSSTQGKSQTYNNEGPHYLQTKHSRLSNKVSGNWEKQKELESYNRRTYPSYSRYDGSYRRPERSS